jgi:transcriptional regulator with XRE-family HTH domain
MPRHHFSGDRLRAIRESRGKRREVLAVETGYSFPSVVAWELGTQPPGSRAVGALADALDVSPGDFYVVEDTPVSA